MARPEGSRNAVSDLQRRKLTFADLERRPVPGTEPQPVVVALVESPTPASPKKELTEAQRARKQRARSKAHPRLAVEEMGRLQEPMACTVRSRRNRA